MWRSPFSRGSVEVNIEIHDSWVLAVGTRQFAKFVPRAASASIEGEVSRE
jgi:hypothetical protein